MNAMVSAPVGEHPPAPLPAPNASNGAMSVWPFGACQLRESPAITLLARALGRPEVFLDLADTGPGIPDSTLAEELLKT
jgi:hypothetical protein